MRILLGMGLIIIECPGCKDKNTFEAGKVNYDIKDLRKQNSLRKSGRRFRISQMQMRQLLSKFLRDLQNDALSSWFHLR